MQATSAARPLWITSTKGANVQHTKGERDNASPRTKVIGYRREPCGHHVPADWPSLQICAFCQDGEEARQIDQLYATERDELLKAYAEYVQGLHEAPDPAA